MANTLREHILFNINVKQLDFINMNVTSSEGSTYEADVIINTIPWKEFDMLVGMPERLVAKISNLKHSSIETRYFQENLNTKAQWIYYPDKKLPYHRIWVRSNFCTGSRGYWTETRKERVYMFNAEDSSTQRFENEYAYPLNTIGKQEIIKELLEWCAKRHVYGLGRWGEHQHYNSDRVVELGMQLAERIGHM